MSLQWGRTLSSAEVKQRLARSFDFHWLQWGRTLSSAEVFPSQSVPLPSSCFNGAALFQVRKFPPNAANFPAINLLQWGRTLSSAEVQAAVGGCRRLSPASMGPHSFKCGSSAVLFLSRNGVHASMGPHSFKCGSPQAVQSSAFRKQSLQWGRTLSSAEVGPPCCVFDQGCVASMGPHSFKCGSLTIFIAECVQLNASMGPHSFKCGSQSMSRHFASLLQSFNGAALFQVRKCGARRTRRKCRLYASMGPHSFKCGSFILEQQNWAIFPCFNGAALFQVRKSGRSCFSSQENFGLQWGRTLSSAEVKPSIYIEACPRALQWGRTLSSAEVWIERRLAAEQNRRFNGAALFQVRKSAPASDALANAAMLQWGRTLSSAEVFSLRLRNGLLDLLQWGRTLSSAEVRQLGV